MAVEIDDLSSLETQKVSELLLQLTSQLQELNPSLDLRRGVFHDTVAYLQAVLEAAIRTNIDRYLSARSLRQINLNPDIADEDTVDDVLSNWGVTRREGTPSSGSVTIELSSPRIVSIPIGARFSANGFVYLADQTFVSRLTPETVVSSSDRLVRPTSNGRFAFSIDVTSEEVGQAQRLSTNELITPEFSIPGYVTSYATTTFSSSLDQQTNRELIASLQTGIAAKTFSNRVTMQALLRSYPAFTDVVRQSIVGFGDSEMTRDQHSLFPVSHGGRADWYIRTTPRLEYRAIPAKAVLLSKTIASSTWQIAITRAAFPGFYEILAVRRPNTVALNSGFKVLSEIRGFDNVDADFAPDIATSTEAAYSSYQTAIVTVEDTTTPTADLTVGQEIDVVCDLSGLPLIGDIQATMNGRDIRSYAADVLVKAPVPCFVTMSMVINQTSGDTPVDVQAVKTAVADFINSTAFTGRIDASRIFDVIHNTIGTAASVTNFHMIGRVRKPSSHMLYLQSSETLQVPQLPKEFVTPRTVQFFATESDIGISVKASLFSPE